jgi:hypothetical protein
MITLHSHTRLVYVVRTYALYKLLQSLSQKSENGERISNFIPISLIIQIILQLFSYVKYCITNNNGKKEHFITYY